MKKTIKKQSTINKRTDPFESMDVLLPEDSLSNIGKPDQRHWTLSNIKRMLSKRKANSLNVSQQESPDDSIDETFSSQRSDSTLVSSVDESVVSRKRDRSVVSSVFYEESNLTATLSQPGDFNPLHLGEKKMGSLLKLLKMVIYVLSVTLDQFLSCVFYL